MSNLSSAKSELEPNLKLEPNLNRTVFKCRIESQRQLNNKIYTSVTTPALDSYSNPSSFQIRSNVSLGTIGSVVTIRVLISGFLKHFKYTDRTTGEIKEGINSSVYLDLIE